MAPLIAFQSALDLAPRSVDCVVVMDLAPRSIDCLIALILSGLATFLGLILLRAMDSKVRGFADLKKASEHEVLCVLPPVAAWRRHFWRRREPHADGSPEFKRAMRWLSSCVLATVGPESPQCFLVASPMEAEGRSTLAATLALACSEAGHRVLLIDGDLQSRSLLPLFSPLTEAPGLSNALLGDGEWREYLTVSMAHPLLKFLPAGTVPVGTDLPIGPLVQLLGEARSEFEVILIDCAAILNHPESIDWICSVDSVLLVARDNYTTQSAFAAALSYLQKLEAPVMGIALNAA